MNFFRYHPISLLVFFTSSISIFVLITNPIILSIGFVSGIFLLFKTNKIRIKNLMVFLVLFLCTVCINPLFNHKGTTILYYFRNGNPLTLESILYGLYFVGIFFTSIIWFMVLSKAFSNDKVLYIFGRISPNLALILSMIVRFLPRFKEKIQEMKENSNKNSIQVLSMMITWSLESSIIMSQSMSTRKFGECTRTSFHLYKIKSNDYVIISWIFVNFMLVLFNYYNLEFSFFPFMDRISFDYKSLMCYFAYFNIVFVPFYCELGV